MLGQTPARTGLASSGSSAAVLRTDSSLVLIPTHVSTAAGTSVTNLKKENFRILEDNEEQTVSYFSQDDAPVSIGFLLDISGSMRPKMPRASEAAAAFFETSNSDDEFFLVEFSDRAKLIVPFTPDSGALYQHILHTRPFGRTSLLDSIHLALLQMRQAHHPRKALVILSDGGDNWSRHSVRAVRNALLESDVQLYAMGVFDPDEAARKTREEKDGPGLLEELAEHSGGRHYPVLDLKDLSEISTRVSRDLRSEYMLGYHPSHSSRDGKYRQVRVKLTISGASPDLRTYYRRGYYAPTE